MKKRIEDLVSVIMPIYNGDKFIRDSIESILIQTYKPIEIILVNDNSTDSSHEIIEEIINNNAHAKIKYLKHIENKGGPFARNAGIGVSEGEFIAFIDQDDIWETEKISFQVDILNKTQSDLNCCGVKYTFPKKKEFIYSIYNDLFHKMTKKERYALFLYKNLIPSFSCVILRSSVIDRIGFIDESYFVADDYDFWLRINNMFNISFSNLIFVTKFEHGRNASWKYIEKNLDDRIRIIDKYYRKDMLSNKEKLYSNAYLYTGFQYFIQGKILEARECFDKSVKSYISFKNLIVTCIFALPNFISIKLFKFFLVTLHKKKRLNTRWWLYL